MSFSKMIPLERVLEGPPWEALWPHMCVPEILQMHVTAQAWNDVKDGPCCELFLFLMKRGPALTE